MHKRSISLEPHVWQRLEKAAAEEGKPISTLLGELISSSLALREGELAMESYELEFGAFSAEEISAADRSLDAAGVMNGLGHSTAESEVEH